jgi:hypothetical protein
MCPCCQGEVYVSPLDVLTASYDLTEQDVRVLRAIWKGCGLPVMTERIFDAMYEDDPDGGPSPSRMYAALRSSLERLGATLHTSGVAIQSVGYRQGFRLKLFAPN